MNDILKPGKEDREVFDAISRDIKSKTAKYREAGKWLDEYCSEDAYWQRHRRKLEELRGRVSWFPDILTCQRERQLTQEIGTRQTPALSIRFQNARDYLFEKYKDQEFVPQDDAKRIILITWLLTDPDAEKSNLNITRVEKWTWEPIDDITKLSRGYAQFSWCQGGRVYVPWMRLARIAWMAIRRQEVEPSDKEGNGLKKRFWSNLVRASIKHLPYIGGFLYDVIYGTLDDKASHGGTDLRKASRKYQVPQRKGIPAQQKRDKGKWYQSRTIQAALITAFVVILVSVVGWIIAFKNNKSQSEFHESKRVLSKEKLPISLTEICQDINSRPLLQQEATAKRYIGIKIEKEHLKLFNIHEYPDDGTFGLTMVLPEEFDESYLTGRKIFCTLEKDKYPELNAAKEGLEFYVSGKIEDAGSKYIKLSDVSLEFD